MPVRTLSRPRLLIGALVCLLLVVALSIMYTLQQRSLDEFDRGFGDGPQAWTSQNPLAYDVLHAIEVAFGTIPLTVLTIVVAGVLVVRGRYRAALWTLGVMAAASVTTYLLKRLFERDRPVWEDPVHSLDSYSFPSGHASGIASAMVVLED